MRLLSMDRHPPALINSGRTLYPHPYASLSAESTASQHIPRAHGRDPKERHYSEYLLQRPNGACPGLHVDRGRMLFRQHPDDI